MGEEISYPHVVTIYVYVVYGQDSSGEAQWFGGIWKSKSFSPHAAGCYFDRTGRGGGPQVH